MSQLATDRYDADMLVGGTWLSGDERAEVIHPYDGQTVGSAPLASADDARAAIAAADSAFADSTLSAYERYELLSYAADALEDDTEDMARLITGEQGKPLSEARSEVSRAVQTLRLSAEEAKRQFGESIPMDAQQGFDRSHAFTQREPLGVVVGITPFNFPLNLMAHKVGPALAAGNTVVGKPAPNTPLSGVRLFEHLEDARQQVGASPGLVNVVPGEGEAVGDPLLSDERVEAISFTGSTAVGKHIAESTGMRELTLELGGNDPTIIWEDTDIEAAAERVVSGACSNAGQVCNSVERVIIPDSIASEVVDALVDAADALTVGDPFEEGTDVASMVDDDQFEKIVEIFEKTVDAGATVETGGNYGGDLGPRVFEPTVLSDVTPEMPAATAETFGPVVPVLTVSDFDEAIEQANNTAYGLEAGLFTQDIDRAKRAADEIDAGGVNINTVSGFRTDHMPYGGFKDSGVGKEGIKYACDHLSKTKLVGFHAGFGENA